MYLLEESVCLKIAARKLTCYDFPQEYPGLQEKWAAEYGHTIIYQTIFSVRLAAGECPFCKASHSS